MECLDGCAKYRAVMISRSAAFLTFALIWPTIVAAIQSSTQNPPDEPLKISTQLVVVDAQLLSKKTGAVVTGLEREHFSLYEDGVKQRITHFSQDKLPLSVVLLLDVSGSVKPVIDRVRDEGIAVLRQLKPDDEVSIVIFGMWATVLQDFTKDRQRIAKRIGDIESIGPWIQEGTHIPEAVYEASNHLAKSATPDNRRVIIIITDNISNQRATGHSVPEAMESLLKSGVTVFGLVVGDFAALANEYFRKGWILQDSIGNYVNDTGGVALRVDQDDAIVKLASVIERVRTRYSLGYTPKNEKRDGKFRTISLKVSPEIEKRAGGITIFARKGYYAPNH